MNSPRKRSEVVAQGGKPLLFITVVSVLAYACWFGYWRLWGTSGLFDVIQQKAGLIGPLMLASGIVGSIKIIHASNRRWPSTSVGSYVISLICLMFIVISPAQTDPTVPQLPGAVTIVLPVLWLWGFILSALTLVMTSRAHIFEGEGEATSYPTSKNAPAPPARAAPARAPAEPHAPRTEPTLSHPSLDSR